MEQIKQYIYMDVDGINSLYAQIVNEMTVERETETEKRTSGMVKGAFAVKAKELFMTDVSLAGERESAHTLRQKTILTDEQKIQLLLDHISENENLIKDYNKIGETYQASNCNFVFFSTGFDTTLDCADWSNAQQQIVTFGYIPFYKAPSEKSDDYEYRDCYFKALAMSQTKVTMNLGIQNMCGYSSYGMTSHLSVMIRALKGHNIPLGVFGHIYRLAERLYQIKPYAVWRAS